MTWMLQGYGGARDSMTAAGREADQGLVPPEWEYK